MAARAAVGRMAALAPLALMLAGCAGEGAEPALPEDAEVIECALAGADGFAPECGVQLIGGADARELVVWHPDGGFRRFERLDDGRWLAPADGADGARVERADDDATVVSVAQDRYRFPPAIFDHGGE